MRNTFISALTPILASILALAAGCGGDDETAAGAAGTPGDINTYLAAPVSCAYDCPNAACPEASEGYKCPALGAWSSIPHAEACGSWDTKYPPETPGSCKATEPTGEAVKRPGLDPATGSRILPDGRATKPAGAEHPFNETDIIGGTTSGIAAVPGTPFVITVDTGSEDHAVRAVDTTKVGASDPVAGFVKFSPPSYLNSAASFAAPNRVYVATDYGVVQALTLDMATGALARDDASSLSLPPDDEEDFYVAGIAASPDGTRLVVSGVEDERAFVYDIDPASPTYKQKLGEASLGSRETFGVYFDPNDPAGTRAYISMWKDSSVIELNVENPAAPKVARSFTTDRNPQGITFLDARWMAVANDYGETISLVDRISGEVTNVRVEIEPGLYGLDVSGVAFDAGMSRLYAILAGVNAIAAYDVDLAKVPPGLTPVGRLPTSWWPSGIVAHPDGSLSVTNLRGRAIGPYLEHYDIGDGDGDEKMRGSVQHIPAPSAADLQAGQAQVSETIAVGARPGYPKVECPAGAADFPVPATNTEGPSSIIKHVFFVVRENKTFDAIMGDMEGVKGDPTYAMKASSADMEKIWGNFRDLARTFTTSDNFYNLAIKSAQGHQWTTYGRATDFCERTWSLDSRNVPLCGISNVGRPEGGSLFEWLLANKVDLDILGEVVGTPGDVEGQRNPIDYSYPGGPFQNIAYNDAEKACYTAARARVACNIAPFVYMTLPNDHTVGASPTNPTPETMCAVNDEATGMLVDGISHSPIWASSLIVVTEDDPQQGGDHVDYHRTPIILVSPWVKRGYVSKTHIDVASLHKLFAHIFGLPYANLTVKNAGLPLDMFTSTPSFTPYTYKPRAWPLECGTGTSEAERELTESWDFANIDDQPGLGEQVMRWMRGKQLKELPPRIRVEVDERNARRARGLPPIEVEEDDD
jgi:DNA-binding beta-propeller fold protein YncE